MQIRADVGGHVVRLLGVASRADVAHVAGVGHAEGVVSRHSADGPSLFVDAKKDRHSADLSRVGLRVGEHRRRLLGVDDVLPEVCDATHRPLEQGLPGGVACLGDQLEAGEVFGRHHEQLPDPLLQRHVRHELAGAGGGRLHGGLRDDGEGVGDRRGALPGPRLARRARLAVGAVGGAAQAGQRGETAHGACAACGREPDGPAARDIGSGRASGPCRGVLRALVRVHVCRALLGRRLLSGTSVSALGRTRQICHSTNA